MKYSESDYRICQIKLPDPNDFDPHPRLLLDGWGIHAGECFEALMPDGWHNIRLEINWDVEGAACWYIPGREDVCPIGLFVRI